MNTTFTGTERYVFSREDPARDLLVSLEENALRSIRGSIGSIPGDSLKAVLVGGSVRDRLLGIPPSDIDCVLIAPVLPDFLRSSPKLGPKGVPEQQIFLYTYGHLRAEIQFVPTFPRRTFLATLLSNLSRRDLTVNSLALDSNGQLFDPRNGIRDLNSRTLSFGVSCSAALSADPVRAMRLFRFVFTLPGFFADRRSLRAVRGVSLDGVPGERVGKEIWKMLLVSPARFPAYIIALQRAGLLRQIFPSEEMKNCPQLSEYHPEGNVLIHTFLTLLRASERSSDPAVLLAALFHDAGKPGSLTEDLSARGHDDLGALMAEEYLERWNIPKETRDRAVALVRDHMLIHGQWTAKTVGRRVSSRGERFARDLLALSIADTCAGNGDLTGEMRFALSLERLSSARAQNAASKSLSRVRGRDVMEICGIPEGPAVGEMLRVCGEIEMENAANDIAMNVEEIVREAVKRIPKDHGETLSCDVAVDTQRRL